MNWLDKLERRGRKLAIPGLMKIVVIGMALVFVCNLLFPQANLLYYLAFSPALILQGQVWRVFTFVFLPPDSSLLFIVFALYFYYLIGTSLENAWGSFRFTLYYFIGMLGAIIAGFLTGSATNSYLNLSLFFAFAAVYPDMQVLLFFLIPIKVKWLAIIDAVLFAVQLIFADWATRAAVIASLANFFIFFGPALFTRLKNYRRREDWRRQMRR